MTYELMKGVLIFLLQIHGPQARPRLRAVPSLRPHWTVVRRLLLHRLLLVREGRDLARQK